MSDANKQAFEEALGVGERFFHGLMLDKSSALRYYKNILCICENRRNDPQKKSADSRLSNANEI